MRKNLMSQLMLHVLDGGFHEPIADDDDEQQQQKQQKIEFDLRLLSNLPLELLWDVLQRLPYAVKVRFGTVSKSWHSKLLSEEGLRSSASTALPSPLPLMCGLEYIEDRETTACSQILCRDQSSSCKSYELDLSFLPKEHLQWCSSDFFVQGGLIGVVGGTFNDLMEENVHSEPPKSELSSLEIFLLNPMTRTWRKLPILTLEDQEEVWNVRNQKELGKFMAESQKWRIKLQINESSISSGKVQFELILLLPVSDWDEDISAVNMSVSAICIYSSVTDKWTVTQCYDHRAHISCSRALCNGFTYTVSDHQVLTRHSLLDGKFCGAYDLQTLETAQAGHYWGTCWWTCWPDRRQFLVEHQGEVLCVQDIPTKVEGCPTFGIWKLNQTSMKWSEFTTLPRVVLDRFRAQMYRAKKNGYSLCGVKVVGQFVCLNVGDHCIGQPSDVPGLVHVFMCHIQTKRWQIGFNNLMFKRLKRRFELFQPRLDIFL